MNSARTPKPGVPTRKDGGSVLRLLRFLFGYADHWGIEELIPRCSFLQGLDFGEEEERMIGIPYLNLIGTRSDFIRIYHLRSSPMAEPRPVLSLLDGLEKILPRSLVPPEIRQGRGDGLVSVASAYLPWAVSNQFLPINHAQFLVDDEVRNKIRQFIRNL